ncbi:MAG: hypothetical protein ABI193_20240, partial [Minicystis sp.]
MRSPQRSFFGGFPETPGGGNVPLIFGALPASGRALGFGGALATAEGKGSAGAALPSSGAVPPGNTAGALGIDEGTLGCIESAGVTTPE